MALQNFVAKRGPTISAVWLNAVDALKYTIFGDAETPGEARTNLTSDAPLEILNGGTGVRSLAELIDEVGGNTASTGVFTPIWSGFDAPPTVNIQYAKSGNIVVLQFPYGCIGTVHGFDFTMGLIGIPVALRPTGIGTLSIRQCVMMGARDGGADYDVYPLLAAVQGDGITFKPPVASPSYPNWTPSGTKGFPYSSQLVYSI